MWVLDDVTPKSWTDYYLDFYLMLSPVLNWAHSVQPQFDTFIVVVFDVRPQRSFELFNGVPLLRI